MGSFLKDFVIQLLVGPQALEVLKKARSEDSPGGKAITVEEAIEVGYAVLGNASATLGLQSEILIPERPIEPDTVRRIVEQVDRDVPKPAASKDGINPNPEPPKTGKAAKADK